MEGSLVTRKIWMSTIVFLILGTSTVNAAVLTTFEDGSSEVILSYDTAGTKSVNIVLPSGVSVLSATMNVSGEFYVQWSPSTPEIGELAVGTGIYRPSLADLDGDGDKDLLIGSYEGTVYAFENNGTATSPSWRRRGDWEFPSNLRFSAPSLADLDGDGDNDLLLGTYDGTYGYENIGSITNPSFSRKTEWDVSAAVWEAQVPSLADLDGDGDYDLLIGTRLEGVFGFENDGSILNPSWKRKSEWDNFFLDYYLVPSLADLDGDGDNDLLVGSRYGYIYGFENNGSTYSLAWNRKEAWDGPNVGEYTAPVLHNLDEDDDLDMIIGEYKKVFYGFMDISGVPTDPSLTLGNDTLWMYPGTFSVTTTTPDFSFELNNYLSICTTPECIIPLDFYSASPGRLVLSNLYVEYESVDTTPPAYSNIGQNNTVAGQDTLFYALWQDDIALSGYIFSTNNTGRWVNDSWVALSGSRAWSNVTKKLNSTVGIHVGWRIYANDSSNNWGDTGVIVLTTIPPADITPPTIIIASPQNATYGSPRIDLNVSADEAVHTWWYSLNAGENITFIPNITITAALGVNHLVVYANDTTGNVGSSDVYFTVALAAETPRKIKKGVIAELETLKSYTTNEHSIKDLDNAIEKIRESLEDGLWVGEDHLDIKHGHKVFDFEKTAVEHLMKITEGKGEHVDPNIAADVQRAILELVKADRLLASISINDAKAVTVTDPVKQKKYEQELEKAEGEMLKAEEEVDKGEYDKAIDHYRKAWEHAQAAIKLGE